MTEDKIKNSRPKKFSHRNTNNSMKSSSNFVNSSSMGMIMVPAIDSPGNLSEAQNSNDSFSDSPAKVEENGELCALCNCGSEMALILGQLTQYSVSQATVKKLDKLKSETLKNNPIEDNPIEDNKKGVSEKTFFRRRRRKPYSDSDSNLPPDMTTFGTAHVQEFMDVLDVNGCVWAHHCCAAWSAGVCQTDSYDLENVDRAVAKALLKKCSHCQRYGASVECQVHRCNKLYHYPCCASAGAFQNITSMILLCPDHLDRTEKLTNAEAFCDACQKTENMNLQLFCTSCGRHFHSYCAEMTIPITPVVRMGWQCSFCKVCQGCKQPGDEEKMLCCDHCDKGYHIYCLDPPINAVPKSTWKCISCRKCDDCGSTRAGGGPSCKWHNNYTLCDRCYQQRKKGQACPVCSRAIRLYHSRDALQCSKCFKCVHAECDPDGVDAKSYVCPACLKEPDILSDGLDENIDAVSSYEQELIASGQKVISIEEAQLFSMVASAEFIAQYENSKIGNNNKMYEGEDSKFDEKMSDSTLDSPYSSLVSDSINNVSQYLANRKRNMSAARRARRSFRGRRFRNPSFYGAISSLAREVVQDETKRQDQQTEISTVAKASTTMSDTNDEEEEGSNEDDGETGLHSTVVIVSTKDSYTLKQDICMCCGSLGKGKDGYLIGCVQCGQCFHPYCVNVKINEVILDRGWRCLDCTVCEGCGRNADEAHLLLCDLCDVSFHTYCLTPPLQEVPVGGWKCQWCAVCEDCGSKDSGFNSLWMANYSQCGPCSSEQYCSICSYAYEANNLVIQCEKCKRWLHGECDGIYSENDANLACSMIYHCAQCRPLTKHLGIFSSLKTSIVSKVNIRKALTGVTQNQSVTRKTKTLHNIKTKKLTRSEIKEQKRAELEATPMIPPNVMADEFGTFELDFGLVKSRLRFEDLPKPSFHLTDAGMKQIKSQVIRAPIQKAVRKPRKTDDSKTSAIMSEEVSCSVEDPEGLQDDNSRLDGDHMDEMDQIGGEADILSPDGDGTMISIKKEEIEPDIMQPDTTAETDDLYVEDDTNVPDVEDVTDPFEFFGVNLLEKHLHMELESIEGGVGSRKKLKKEKRKERRLKKAARLAEEARLAFDILRGPSVPDPTALIQTPPPKEKVKTVEVSTPQPVSSSDDTIQPPIAPPILKDEIAVFPASSVEVVSPTVTSPKVTNPKISVPSVSDDITDNSAFVLLRDHDMHDLPDVPEPETDLPQVAGHEVEQLFAGIEKERIAPSQGIIGNDLPDVAPSNMNPSSITPQSILYQGPGGQHLPPQNPSPMISGQANQISGQSNQMSPVNSTDVFKVVFGDDASEGTAGKKGDFPYPKIDTQKQLKKWEQDEKLGEFATISPVLYANMMHKNLITEYEDWPSRARAIARLWRKLPGDQREPFRLRARDNRVRKKTNKAALAGQQLEKNMMKEPPPGSDVMKDLNPMLPPATSPLLDKNTLTSPTSTKENVKTESKSKSIPTILTVSEPQKLSPLLHNISPTFSMAAISGITPTSPNSTFFQTTSAPSKVSLADIPKIETPPIKQQKPKKPKLTKEEREQKKMQKKLQNSEKEKQWKRIQQQRIFEQQRQLLLTQGKVEQASRITPGNLDPSFPDDPMQHLIMKMQSEQARLMNPPPKGDLLPPASSTSTTINPIVLAAASFKNPADVLSSKASVPANIPSAVESKQPQQPSPSINAPTISKSPKKENNVTKKPEFDTPREEERQKSVGHDASQVLDAPRTRESETALRGSLEYPGSSANIDQHQSYLFQQQFLASQQQYIQWQLAQQQQSGLYGQGPFHGEQPNEVDSEEKHQERLRFLYQQRQYHKDNPMFMHSQGLQPSSNIPPMPPNMPTSSTPQQTQSTKGASSGDKTPLSSDKGSTPDSSKTHPPQPPSQMFGDNPGYPGHAGYPQFNAPDAAMYHQIMEYMKLRKGHDIDPNIPAPVQFYNTMMAEIAKQYYQRHASFNKVYPPGMPAQSAVYHPYPARPPERDYYDERSHHPYSKGNQDYPSNLPYSHSSLTRPPLSTSSYPTNQDRPPPEQRHIYTKPSSTTTLQKSASFEISRIAADSTSNDDYLAEEAAKEQERKRKEQATRSNGTSPSSHNENEISSSRLADSHEDTEVPSTTKTDCTDGSHCGTDNEQQEEELDANDGKCTDGIHCGTDDEDGTLPKSSKCDDGIHCGTDNEDETSRKNDKCTDGIHCGTDDEDETPQKNGKCADGIHCGTDDEGETAPENGKCSDDIHCGTDDEGETARRIDKCTDGIHCGTDDEDETSQKKGKCADGIHCGTDDEDETAPKNGKCTDGIHCGTDDEDETAQKNGKCTDGIHCGTDDEDETAQKNGKCADGIHCGTGDEDETVQKNSKCTDGIHCDTDDEGETEFHGCIHGIHCDIDDEGKTVRKTGRCADGIHCGTDDEDETLRVNGACADGIHCGTDDEDETVQKDGRCADGIHCGTDDEDETMGKTDRCADGIHCGTDDEDEPVRKNGTCADGIHCGTDDEDETMQKNRNCADHFNPDGTRSGSGGGESKTAPQDGNCSGTITKNADGMHSEGNKSEENSKPDNHEKKSDNGISSAKNNSGFPPNFLPSAAFQSMESKEDFQQSSLHNRLGINVPVNSTFNSTSCSSTANVPSGSNPSLTTKPQEKNSSPFSVLAQKKDCNQQQQQSKETTNVCNSSAMPSSDNSVSVSGTFNSPVPTPASEEVFSKKVLSPVFPANITTTIPTFPAVSNVEVSESLLQKPLNRWAFPNLTAGGNPINPKDGSVEQLVDSSFKGLDGASHDLSSSMKSSSTSSIKSPFSPTSSPLPKQNLVSLHPGSPHYYEVFVYQHHLLLMQFQQYQFQLQVQYQQLSQQQMSPQQQFLLQQQFHQQMILLQQQFMQQQGQLYRMAANGIHFTEQQLNAMGQQQLLTQKNYHQWVMALSPEQQIMLQQQMQGRLHQVKVQMAQMMQHTRLEEDQKKKPSKPRGRLNKKKASAAAASSAATTTSPSIKTTITVTSSSTTAASISSVLTVTSSSTSTSVLVNRDKELTSAKVPVPELSEEMKRASRVSISTPKTLPSPVITTSHTTSDIPIIKHPPPSSFSTPSKPEMINKLLHSTEITQKAPQVDSSNKSPQQTEVIQKPVSSRTTIIEPSKVDHPRIDLPSKPTPAKTPFILPPEVHSSKSGAKTEKKSEIISSVGAGSVTSRHDNIQESFLKQQELVKEGIRQARNEMKAANMQQKAERQMALQRQVFFSERFPMHPSQVLHKTKITNQIKSPTTLKSPVMEASVISVASGVILPPAQVDTTSYNQQMAQMATEMMKKTSVISPVVTKPSENLVSRSLATPNTPLTKSQTTPITCTSHTSHSSFSVSDLLSSSSKPQHSIQSKDPILNYQDSSKLKTGISQAGHEVLGALMAQSSVAGEAGQGMDPTELLKKSLLKPPKAKKDTRLLEEKKRLRELERQKKREEKAKLKELKEQRKAEKVQQRLLKQKAQQEAKLQVKKRTKMPTIAIPDMPTSSTEKTLSPTSIPRTPPSPERVETPKIPLCEPDVQMFHPLSQPAGFSTTIPTDIMKGHYGAGELDGLENEYTEKSNSPSPSNTLFDTTNVKHIFPDTQLFPSPDETDFQSSEDKKENIEEVKFENLCVDSKIEQEVEDAANEKEDDDILLRCNNCYKSFPSGQTIWYVDKNFDGIIETNLDCNELYQSEQIAFCSQECIDEFQRKVDFTLPNDDVELVDAVKTAAMVSLDKSQTFMPLPTLRGEKFAEGMDPTRQNLFGKDYRNIQWKRWDFKLNSTKKSRHRLSKDELDDLMMKFDVRLRPAGGIRDMRTCMFCKGRGDGDSMMESRLLNYDVDTWVHLNCALWSTEVYEALNGGLHNVDKAYARSLICKCTLCLKDGATLHCSHTFGVAQRIHCEKAYHFLCAHQAHCVFYKDKTILCKEHKSFGVPDEELRTFSVRRKVYIERSITKQIVKMLSLNNDLERKEYTFRVGNLIFHELGQIPINLLENFSTKDYCYPIGFETTSIFWDHVTTRKRRYYTCSIYERFRTPRFKVKVHSNGTEGIHYTSCSSKGSWEEIVTSIQKQREKEGLLKVFPEFICGEDLFGLSEATIQRMIESLPGIDTIQTYNFRFGRTPILIAELPLALNPTGCIRSEKFRKHHATRPLAMRTASDHSKSEVEAHIADESWLTYSQRVVHSTKIGQYRRMRMEWRNNVVLGRSRIQGLGLFAKKEIEENTFVIEYIGALIRNELADRLEKQYERQNRGIYMFRIDNDVVVDATMTGGPARYINHSCDPNCVAEIVSIEREKKIIIIANRKIEKGEELTYDYKFEIEDDSSKIACLCGSANCRKWMN